MIINENYNMSLFLLLPLVAEEGRKADYYIKKYLESLVDGYSQDINKPWLDCHISIVFDYELMDEVDIVELSANGNFATKTSYLIHDKYVCSYALKIPDEHYDEYAYILRQDYSKVSTDTKNAILSFWGMSYGSKVFNELFTEKETYIDITKEILPEENYIEREGRGAVISGLFIV